MSVWESHSSTRSVYPSPIYALRAEVACDLFQGPCLSAWHTSELEQEGQRHCWRASPRSEASQTSDGSGGLVTHWTPKRGSRIARLSHRPSTANLLAQ